jgi:hypothetical protein
LNWTLVTAGTLMLLGAILHGIVGDQALRKIGRLELPPNPFGSPADTRVGLRLTWHFGTIAFALVGMWLVAAGLQPQAPFAVGVAYLSGTMLSCYGLIGGTVRIYRHGLGSLFKHPVLILIIAAGLVWWGSTSM